MALLKGTTAYLAGPVEHSQDATSWRDEISDAIKPLGIYSLNPMDPPDWCGFKGADPKQIYAALAGLEASISPGDAWEIQRNVIKVCRRMAYACDFIICRLPKKFTVGTFEELTIGKECGKPILFWIDDVLPSTWALGFVHDYYEELDINSYFFKSKEALVEYINKIDKGQITIDPCRWIFLEAKNENRKPDRTEPV